MGGGSQQTNFNADDSLGGQYANTTGGYGGTYWPGFTQDLSMGLNKGFQQYAAGVPASLPRAAGSDQISQPFSIQGQQQQGYPLIPTNSSANGDQSQQQIMQILQMLLGSGGSY